jgi:hypothetical protein
MKERCSFSEEKEPKRLLLWGRPASVPIRPNRRLGPIGTEVPTPPRSKSFLVTFFQKSNFFLKTSLKAITI